MCMPLYVPEASLFPLGVVVQHQDEASSTRIYEKLDLPSTYLV